MRKVDIRGRLREPPAPEEDAMWEFFSSHTPRMCDRCHQSIWVRVGEMQRYCEKCEADIRAAAQASAAHMAHMAHVCAPCSRRLEYHVQVPADTLICHLCGARGAADIWYVDLNGSCSL